MSRSLFATLAPALLLVAAARGPARADDAVAVLDKAIQAIGGEEALKKAAAFTWKSKGTITFGGNDNDITIRATAAMGLDRYRSEFEGTFGGNDIKGITVLAGDKGWRKFGDDAMPLEGDQLANEKRNVYLLVGTATLLPLKGKGFKLESAGEEKVDGKPAAVLKVTGPDGKDFKLSFDKETGLPVKQVATVAGFNGEDYAQETTFAAYKDFGGIKKATKVASKRDGEPFLSQEVTEFKAVDKVDPETFAEPK